MPGPFFRIATALNSSNSSEILRNVSETFNDFNATVLSNLSGSDSNNSTTDVAENERIRNVWIFILAIAAMASLLVCQYSRNNDRRRPRV